MKKIITIITALSLILISFTGCMYGEESYTINEDGSGQMHSRVSIEKEAYDEVAAAFAFSLADLGISEEQTSSMKLATVNGVECYVFEEDKSFAGYDELKSCLESGDCTGVYAFENGIRYILKENVSKNDLAALDSQETYSEDVYAAVLTFKMPKDVVKTTGTVGSDKRTVTFEFKISDFSRNNEIMISMAAETVKPALMGFTTKKTYNKAITVTANDQSGISRATYKKGTGKTYSFNLIKSFSKNGKYTVSATDNYGNKTTKTFTIKDTSKPTISGVANGKTYTSDRTITFTDNCAVKSASLNGRSIESGHEVTDAGTYKLIVKDVNGLTKTVKFKVK